MVDDCEQLWASWMATEHDIRSALDAVASEIPEAAQRVTMLLEHNELGIAFEALVQELDYRKVHVSQDTLEHLRAAADRMGDDAELACRAATHGIGSDASRRIRAPRSVFAKHSRTVSVLGSRLGRLSGLVLVLFACDSIRA